MLDILLNINKYKIFVPVELIPLYSRNTIALLMSMKCINTFTKIEYQVPILF